MNESEYIETRVLRKVDFDRLLTQVDDLCADRIERNARIKALEEQLAGAVKALEEIAALGRTDGPAAPLLVRAGDIAEAAWREAVGE